MKNNRLQTMNIFATVLTLIFPSLFFCRNVSKLVALGVNGIAIIFIGVIVASSVILFFASAIQGIRSIANGRAGTIKDAALFQLLLPIPNVIASLGLMMFSHSTNDSVLALYLTAFIILFFVSLIRILKVANVEKEELMYIGSPETAKKILLICIAIVFFVIALIKFVEAHPIIFTGIMIIIVLRLVAKLRTWLFGESSSFGDSFAPDQSGGLSDSDISRIQRELNHEYAQKYELITGDTPGHLTGDFLLPDDQKEAVEELKKNLYKKGEEKGLKEIENPFNFV